MKQIMVYSQSTHAPEAQTDRANELNDFFNRFDMHPVLGTENGDPVPRGSEEEGSYPSLVINPDWIWNALKIRLKAKTVATDFDEEEFFGFERDNEGETGRVAGTLRLFVSDTEEEDFGGFSTQEEDEDEDE
ncbi:hypothetical protein AAFF_G00315550 [Aldrovandia affinis]|uniref:Uncharacterized protein n=1 Tax=Aldrovandia affinis TaxID=143900 RepID=A0AAD7SMX9_9TELE|nr:hypothetical protein AAFF_G00315550 [Aldrovandia affinis]